VAVRPHAPQADTLRHPGQLQGLRAVEQGDGEGSAEVLGVRALERARPVPAPVVGVVAEGRSDASTPQTPCPHARSCPARRAGGTLASFVQPIVLAQEVHV